MGSVDNGSQSPVNGVFIIRISSQVAKFIRVIGLIWLGRSLL